MYSPVRMESRTLNEIDTRFANHALLKFQVAAGPRTTPSFLSASELLTQMLSERLKETRWAGFATATLRELMHMIDSGAARFIAQPLIGFASRRASAAGRRPAMAEHEDEGLPEWLLALTATLDLGTRWQCYIRLGALRDIAYGYKGRLVRAYLKHGRQASHSRHLKRRRLLRIELLQAYRELEHVCCGDRLRCRIAGMFHELNRPLDNPLRETLMLRAAKTIVQRQPLGGYRCKDLPVLCASLNDFASRFVARPATFAAAASEFALETTGFGPVLPNAYGLLDWLNGLPDEHEGNERKPEETLAALGAMPLAEPSAAKPFRRTKILDREMLRNEMRKQLPVGSFERFIFERVVGEASIHAMVDEIEPIMPSPACVLIGDGSEEAQSILQQWLQALSFGHYAASLGMMEIPAELWSQPQRIHNAVELLEKWRTQSLPWCSWKHAFAAAPRAELPARAAVTSMFLSRLGRLKSDLLPSCRQWSRAAPTVDDQDCSFANN